MTRPHETANRGPCERIVFHPVPIPQNQPTQARKGGHQILPDAVDSETQVDVIFVQGRQRARSA